MTLRYIESRPDEDWQSVSENFFEWAKARIPPGDWGYLEGASIQVNGRQFLGFAIPARHAALTKLFLEWAAINRRLLGIVDGERVVFPDEPDLFVALPASERSIPAPPWLKDI